jgi:hypothetical protein
VFAFARLFAGGMISKAACAGCHTPVQRFLNAHDRGRHLSECGDGGRGGGGFATAEPVTVTVTVTLCEAAMRGMQCACRYRNAVPKKILQYGTIPNDNPVFKKQKMLRLLRRNSQHTVKLVYGDRKMGNMKIRVLLLIQIFEGSRTSNGNTGTTQKCFLFKRWVDPEYCQ